MSMNGKGLLEKRQVSASYEKLQQRLSADQELVVQRMMLELGIEKDDPMFDVLLCMKSIEFAVEQLPDEIQKETAGLLQVSEFISQHVMAINASGSGILAAAGNLEKKLDNLRSRLDAPRGPQLRHLLWTLFVGVVFGWVFGDGLIQGALSTFCEYFSSVCVVNVEAAD